MKVDEAIEKLNSLKTLSTRSDNVIGSFAGEAIDMAIEALKKHTPNT